MLAGNGFYEIFTNSITNSAYFDEAELTHAVKMINNLSADLDMLRPSLLPTGLEVIAHNINRKNANLCLFEFGKTYHKQQDTQYAEEKHLSLYVSGDVKDISWNNPAQKADYYFLKGICEKLFVSIGATDINYEQTSHQDFSLAASIKVKNKAIGTIGLLSEKKNKQFGIKQPVFVADINWDLVIGSLKKNGFTYKEISKFPSVQRDLSLVLPKNVTYAQVEKTASALQMVSLQSTRLFDIFESEKLGADKKSMAVNFTFGDSQKTLTDAEIDLMMNKIIGAYEQQLGAEIRK
jgi:phenylalanyl-tRNA synthetase beta chain